MLKAELSPDVLVILERTKKTESEMQTFSI